MLSLHTHAARAVQHQKEQQHSLVSGAAAAGGGGGSAARCRRQRVVVRMAPPDAGLAAAPCVEQAAPAPAAQVVEELLRSLPSLPEPGSAAFEFESGSFLERYEMSEVLGKGTFGSVRRCVDTTTGQAYAVKVIPKRSHDGKTDRTAFIAREVGMWRTLAALSPRVVGLVGAYQDRSNIYIVQELLLQDMQHLLDEQGILPEYEAATAMRCVLEALAALHEADIVYGDVKPSNFARTKHYPSMRHQLDPSLHPSKGDIEVKMIDFGTAQLCKDGCSVAEGISGTPVFLAPEVCANHRCSISMDVWAAGAMLYLMLTGQFPLWDVPAHEFKLRSIKEAVKVIQAGAVHWDIPAVQALSPSCQALLRRMLVADPAQRCSIKEALEHPWLQEQLAKGQQQQ